MWLRNLTGLTCLGLSLAGEGTALHLALTLPTAAFWQALAIHGLAILPGTLGVWLLLPPRYQSPLPGALAFLASSMLLLPGLGMLGMTMALLPGLYAARHKREPAWTSLDMPGLPFQPIHSVAPEATIMRDGLASVLAHFDDPQQRQQAITACRHLPYRQSIPLLRRGLADASDEVRLLAYAMLNTIERKLDSRTQKLEAAIDEDDDRYGNRAEALAELYWEYHYLQLAQGSTAAYLLESALTHMDQALMRRPTPHRWLLRGRICRERGDYDAARAAFDHCERLGMDDDDLAPQRAELAFHLGRYSEIPALLHRLSANAATQPPLGPVTEYWR